MKRFKELHLTYYGNVDLLRVYCSTCQGMTIVVDNIKKCCGVENKKDLVETVEYMISPTKKRKGLTVKERKNILLRQNNRCLYCNMLFGTPYFDKKRRKVKSLLIHYDHVVPFSYSYNNQKTNFVASCHICNLIKSNKVFETLEEAKEYVGIRREEKEYIEFLEPKTKTEKKQDMSRVQ